MITGDSVIPHHILLTRIRHRLSLRLVIGSRVHVRDIRHNTSDIHSLLSIGALGFPNTLLHPDWGRQLDSNRFAKHEWLFLQHFASLSLLFTAAIDPIVKTSCVRYSFTYLRCALLGGTMKGFILTLATFALVMMAISPVFAETINVPGDYDTIQEALDVAESGDEVLVQPGTYYENLIWPSINGIELVAAGDTSNTFIDGNSLDRVLTIVSEGEIDASTNIQGFTIQNGVADGDMPDCFGGGMLCIGSSPTIMECSFKSNSARSGGGLFFMESFSHISDCDFSWNSAEEDGAGLFVNESGVLLSDCMINNNTASVSLEGGGGGAFSLNSDIEFQGCIIQDNVSIPYYGGGMYCIESTIQMIDCDISNNIAGIDGGGIVCDENIDLSLFACTIHGNEAHYGGGMYIESSDFTTIVDTHIFENSAYEGGGILCVSSSLIEVINCHISANQVVGEGGGVYSENSGLDASRSVIIGNTAYDGGGFALNNCDAVISNCTIFENAANVNGDGGGIYLRGQSNPVITNCAITDNSGEGLYVTDGSPNVSFNDCFNNSGGNYGGAGVDTDLGVPTGENANGDPCDNFDNIALDPMYFDPDNDDFHLQDSSPCIDAGDPASPLDPDNTVADIGAFYYDPLSVADLADTELPGSYVISPAYPNPFNPTTTISVTLPRPADLNVSVFNINGQQVASLASGTYHVGSHTFTFDASNLASGLYFIRAAFPGHLDQVQKIMLVR